EVLAAGVLYVMPVALRHVADIAGGELLEAHAAVRSEHAHAGPAGDVVLPLVGVGMPMQLAQAARLDLHDRAGHRRRDRELALGDEAVGAAGIGLRPLRQ